MTNSGACRLRLTTLDEVIDRVGPHWPRGFMLAALALVAASCGGDDAASSSTLSVERTSSSAAPVADACAVVPTADVAAVTELAVDDGVAAGDDRRRVCTFQDQTSGVGITVGIEAGGRFDEKAELSRRSLEVEGEAIESIGDRALFFFSDQDLPEGVGGVLVAVGDLTVDITLQGLDEDALREAGINLAELAVGNL